MALVTITEIRKIPNLEILIADLEIADLEHSRLYDEGNDEQYQQAYEHHWSVREAINATPARTLSELRAKARAAVIALDLDEDFECHVPGSARELAKSLVEDILMMGALSGASQ